MTAKRTGPGRRLGSRAYALLLLIIAAAMLLGGAQLLWLGGSPYYAICGLALAVVGGLLWSDKRAAASIYGLLVLATIIWALFEVGLDGWALMPRLLALVVVGTPLLISLVREGDARRRVPAALLLAGISGTIGLGLHAMTDQPVDPIGQAGRVSAPAALAKTGQAAGDDWRYYGGTAAGSRFSALGQITPGNVDRLKVAWRYRTGVPGSQITPLKIGGAMYLCIGGRRIVALHPETGRELWSYAITAPDNLSKVCRGVAHYQAPDASGPCGTRIFGVMANNDLVALDASTGKLCPDFGESGRVSLNKGISPSPANYYGLHSPPTLIRGNIVVGSRVSDGQYWGEPSGVVRAFDAMTGKLSWAFDIGRLDRKGEPPEGETFTASTPNVWGAMSTDEELGLIYLPTGNSTPDYYGVQRRPFDERFSSSVVALDGSTGTVRWVFQTTHHDLWDYDLPSQPTLVDLGATKALIQSTKRGEIFILDRATGKPVFPVTERKVPTSGAVPGERIAPTQPFSDSLPSFRGPTLNERAMWGATPLDQLWCRIRFRQARYEGTMTPIGLQPSITHPGYTGGMNWGGVTIDVDRGLMIVNSMRLVNYNRLLPRAEADRMGIKPIGAPGSNIKVTYGAHAQAGTPYAADISAFLSFTGAPCQAPPYGMLSAVDLKTGKLVWNRPFGTAESSGLFGVPSGLPITLGTPNVGGGIATRGGLFFIGATTDPYLRAYSIMDGRELWRSRLPGGGQATPMTYRSADSGRQFVVIFAGGHRFLKTTLNDQLVAYALPKE